MSREENAYIYKKQKKLSFFLIKFKWEKKKAYVTINQLEEMRTWTIKKGI